MRATLKIAIRGLVSLSRLGIINRGACRSCSLKSSRNEANATNHMLRRLLAVIFWPL